MLTTFRSPELVEFGQGASDRIADICAAVGVARPLIVTDAFIAASPLLKRLTGPLDAAGIQYGVFDQTVPEPTTDSIDALAAHYAAGTYDGLIAFGGGSSMDSAKALAIIEAYGGTYADHVVPNTPDGSVMPIICVPTTAGSGSEVTNACILKDSASGEKLVYLGQACVPQVALIDYEFSLDMPAKLTASTGIDALSHALEAYTSTGANPFSDAMALSALALIGSSLRTAVREPTNRAARERMMVGATQAGYAFTSAGVTLVHGMTAPVGGLFHIQHGVSNGMFAPTVHEWSAEASVARYATAARALGFADSTVGDEEAAAGIGRALRALNRDLGLPSLQEYGVDEERYLGILDSMVEQAFLTGGPGLNPRVPTPDEMRDLYRAALSDSWDSAA